MSGTDELATALGTTTAHRLMRAWWAQHGTTTDDAAFQSWVATQVPAPPTNARRTQEMHQVESLSHERTSTGIQAATWLESYGKDDIWKLYMHDQAELLPTATGDTDKTEIGLALDMAKTVADALGLKDQQSAPYVLEPSLRTDHTVAPGDVCPCSYPSRHAAEGAAALTYLSQLAPRRRADYLWMQGQIDYSRIYMAGHVRSDIVAGTLLGNMIGEYFLVTRGHAEPSTVGPAA